MDIQLESGQIQDAAILAAKIASGAVTEAKLGSSAVTAVKIGTGAVTEDKIGSGAVTSAKIGSDAVDGSKIADDAIGSEHLAAGAVDSDAISNGSVGYAKLNSSDIETTLAGSTSKLVRADAIQNAINNAIEGRSWKNACLVATTANITLSGEQTIDGVSTSSSRVLVWNQSTASENGIYVSASGSWSRASDFDGAGDKIAGSAVLVLSGTDNDNVQFVCTNNTEPTVGTDDINFTQLQAGVADDSVSTAKLQDGAVSTAKIADDAVTSAKLGAGAVDATALGSGAVTATKIGSGAVETAKIADDAVTAAKCGFATNWDVLSPNGVLTSFDLSETIDDTFAFVLVVRNGVVLKQVAASPSGMDEYTIDLTGGAGGVSQLTFGAAPTNGSDLRCMFLA